MHRAAEESLMMLDVEKQNAKDNIAESEEKIKQTDAKISALLSIQKANDEAITQSKLGNARSAAGYKGLRTVRYRQYADLLKDDGTLKELMQKGDSEEIAKHLQDQLQQAEDQRVQAINEQQPYNTALEGFTLREEEIKAEKAK
jgi:hypothetical protein